MYKIYFLKHIYQVIDLSNKKKFFEEQLMHLSLKIIKIN